MSPARWVACALALFGAAGCVDPDAGGEILTGRAALIVGLDLVSRGIPGSPAGTGVTHTQPGTANHVITLPLANLPPLVAGAAYQVWLLNQAGNTVQRIGASHQLERPDTVGRDPVTEELIIVWRAVGQPENVQSFESPPGMRHVLRVRASDAAAAGASLTAFTHVIVTIGSGADASPSASPVSAWFRYRDPALTGTAQYLTGPARFAFQRVPGADAFTLTPWIAFGGGSVEFLNVVGFGLVVRQIARPPIGFFYELWLVDGNGVKPPLKIGPLASPAPAYQPLVEADVTTIPDVVSNTQVLRGARWTDWDRDLRLTFCSDGAQPNTATCPDNAVDRYTSVEVVLRAKQHLSDAVVPPAIVFDAPIPRRLDRLPAEYERSMRRQ